MKESTAPVLTLSEKDKARFWAKVNKNGPLPDQSNSHYAGLGRCWSWLGYKDKDGYGNLSIQGKTTRAHRVSYLLAGGKLNDGRNYVLHSCDYPECTNPEHLKAGSNEENMIEMAVRGRAASGDRHGSKIHPNRWCRGDAHHSRLYPERLARGDRHNSRTKPESVPNGERVNTAKLSFDQVREIRLLYASGGRPIDLAVLFGVRNSTICKIAHRKTWKHVP